MKKMSIIKYYHHRGKIDDIAVRHHQFSKLKNLTLKTPHFEWRDRSTGALSHHVQVAFFGKSGYGKSSTVNYFFGNSVLKTSDIASCTRRCETLDFELSPNCYLSLADFPGIGESEYLDKEYLQMYTNFLSSSTVVVYILRADQRDLAIDESAYRIVFPNADDKKKVVFALNCCDKIEPITRSHSVEPNPEQRQNIDRKIKSIRDLFNPVNSVIPYSATTGWNINKLANEIVTSILTSYLLNRQ